MLFLLKTLIVIEALMAIGLLVFRWALAPALRRVVSPKLWALALITPAVALVCGNIDLFYLYLTLAVAFNARSRTELAGTYLFLLPLMPMLTAQTVVGGVYLFAMSAVLAMGLGALIGALVTGSRRSLTLGRYDLAICAILGIFIFIYDRDGSATSILREAVLQVLAFAGPYLLVSRAVRDRADLDHLVARLCLGATVTAVTACFQARWHWILFETYYQALHVPFPIVSSYTSMRAGFLRTGGSLGDYSSAGLFLASMLTLTVLHRRLFKRAGFWVVTAVLVGGLFSTQSRGAWVAAIVGLAFVAAYLGRWLLVLLLAGAATVAEVAILLFAGSGRLAELAGTTGAGNETGAYRATLLSRGLDQVRAHPLFGQPPRQIVANMKDLTQGEHIVDFVNSHLYIAMGGGVPLFIVWCVVWLSPVVAGWRQRRGNGAPLAAMPAAVLVPVMVALIFTSSGDRNLIWPTIALALAGPSLLLAGQIDPARARPRRKPPSPVAMRSATA